MGKLPIGLCDSKYHAMLTKQTTNLIHDGSNYLIVVLIELRSVLVS